ncbi:hypothetical protein [Nocardioides sp.]|uniref:hypothetical protein n=1 Tax=Nocardioides sp. TaxID=35761 RepID=UPI002C796EEE|nr:hypothetical protein [Nocardioides sp.]HSX67024.1 hypothetical protein [Nocardioides sp.]
MHRLKTLRRLGAVALATATLSLAAAPAQASVVQTDPTLDVSWDGSPTSQERQRTDVTSVAYTLGSANVIVRVNVRGWANLCTTGIPCSGVTWAVNTGLYDGLGRRFDLDLQRSDLYGNPSGLTWPNGTTTCSGEVGVDTSTVDDYVRIAVPRRCFPDGRHIVGAKTYLTYGTAAAHGTDWTSQATVDWIPNS